MTLLALASAGVATGGLCGWFATLWWIPRFQTDRLFAQFRAQGMEFNVLSPGFVRSARNNAVPTDNPDTMTRAAMLDLSMGPLVFEAQVPDGVQYWSVSVFARNGDTVFVANDSELGPGPFRLALRKNSRERIPERQHEALVPGDRGFLIVRLVLPDRSDRASIAAHKSLIGDAAVRSG